MADALYPDDLQELAESTDEEYEEFEDDYDTEVESDDDPQFRESVAFDGIDFVRNVRNEVKTASPEEAFQQWCRTCIATEQGSLDLYPENFGIDMKRVRSSATFSESVAVLSREIERALMADSANRTASVDTIAVRTQDGDSIELTVTVTGADNAQREIVASIDNF